jgi:S1-C subfamily serine protease
MSRLTRGFRGALLYTLSILLLPSAAPVLAQRGSRERDIPPPRANSRFLIAFRPATAEAAKCTVCILCDDKEAALGTIVGPDGWILTKHSLLSGKVACTLKSGATLPARIVGIHEPFDLAMLKVEANDLLAAKFTESQVAPVGNWLVSPGPGDDPVAVGVMSVATRTPSPGSNRPIRRPPSGPNAAFLGVSVVPDTIGLKIGRIVPQSGAAKAGLKVDDKILSVHGTAVTDEDSLFGLLGKMKPGDVVAIKIVRDGNEIELKTTLGTPPADYLGLNVSADGTAATVTRIAFQSAAAKAGLKVDDKLLAIQGQPITDQDSLLALQGKMKPGDVVTVKLLRDGKEMELKATLEQRSPRGRRDQNLMGSELSERRNGFPTFFQSDAVIKPKDCGGPVCDLDGHVLGINIARAGRVESYAIPTEAITPLLADLMSGKLSPKLAAVKKQIDDLKAALKKAEEDKAAADKKLNDAQAELKKQETERAQAEKKVNETKAALAKAEKELSDKK